MAFVPAFVSAESLKLPGRAGSIEVTGGSGETKVVVTLPQKVDGAAAFVIGNPARLVIDVPASIGLTEKNTRLTLRSKPFSRLRIGSEKGKTRFVFDFSRADLEITDLVVEGKSDDSSFSASILEKGIGASVDGKQTANTVVPTVSQTATPTAKPTAATPSPTPTQSPSPKPTQTVVPTSVATQVPTASPKSTASQTPSPTPSPTPTVTPASTIIPATVTVAPDIVVSPTVTQARVSSPKKNSLVSIGFDDAGTALHIVLANPVNYSLTQKQSDVFTILLEGASSSRPSLLLEQFPPQGMLGFQAVVPVETKTGISIDLFMESGYQPEAKWNPTRNHSELTLKASPVTP